jgi:hypothetical protein
MSKFLSFFLDRCAKWKAKRQFRKETDRRFEYYALLNLQQQCIENARDEKRLKQREQFFKKVQKSKHKDDYVR